MTVGELLAILRITKQSLSRVLGQLVRLEFIVQRPGPHDRRQRLLELTAKGRDLERQLSKPQRARSLMPTNKPDRRLWTVSGRSCWGSSPLKRTGVGSAISLRGSFETISVVYFAA